MQVARVAVPPVIEKRNAVPWLFFVFGCLVFAWLFNGAIKNRAVTTLNSDNKILQQSLQDAGQVVTRHGSV